MLKYSIILASLWILHAQTTQVYATNQDAVVAALHFVEKSMSGDVEGVQAIIRSGATHKRGKPGSLISGLLRDQEHIRKGNPMTGVRLREVYVVQHDDKEKLKDRTLRYYRERGSNVTEGEAAVSADAYAKAHKLTKNRTLCMLFYERSGHNDSVSLKLVAVTLEKIKGRLLIVHVWDD